MNSTAPVSIGRGAVVILPIIPIRPILTVVRSALIIYIVENCPQNVGAHVAELFDSESEPRLFGTPRTCHEDHPVRIRAQEGGIGHVLCPPIRGTLKERR